MRTGTTGGRRPGVSHSGSRQRRLRVAYLASSLRPGGAERQMIALAGRLPRDRFEVDFITLSEPGVDSGRARATGAQVFSLGPSPPPDIGPVRIAWRRWKKAVRYLAILRRGRYDIVDAWLYPTYDLAALTRPLTRMPIVVGGRRSLGGTEDLPGGITRLMRALTNIVCAAVVANSRAVATDTATRERVAEGKLRVIYNGVEAAEPIPDHRRADLRTRWGVRPGDLVIGCVANLRVVKRQDVLVDAVARLADHGRNVHLVLVGEGPTQVDLERMIRDRRVETRVTLHGTEANARDLYGAFDVVALASDAEGLPNTLLEAAAAGRAVVATRVGGVPEVVVDRVTGLLVPPGDAPSFATALDALAADAPLREALGQAGRERATTVFGMDRFVAEFASLYEELVARRG